MSSPKSHSEGTGTSFASGYKYFGNDKAIFVLLMEPASWFAWSKKTVTRAQFLMTEMIDFLMPLAFNSLLIISFTKSLVTWVMAIVLFSTAVWVSWNRKSYALSLDVKMILRNFFVVFVKNKSTNIFWPNVNFHFLLFFDMNEYFAKLFQGQLSKSAALAKPSPSSLFTS